MTLRLLVEALAITQVLAAIATALAILLDRRSRSSSTVSWLLLIAAIPLLGTVLYWLAGKPWLPRYRQRQHEELSHELREQMLRRQSVAVRSVRAALAQMGEPTRGLAILAGQISGMSPVGGNDCEFFVDSRELFSRLVEDIDRANQHIHVLYYIVLDDEGGGPVLRALARAAERGVTVRFLVDGLGSRLFFKSPMRRELESKGVRVVEALPTGLFRMLFARIDLRNHRKIVVVDGDVSYIGSHNLADETFKVKPRFAPWVDATGRLVGPVTNDLQRVFIEDWWLETGELLVDLLRPPPREHGPIIGQVVATGPSTYEQAMPEVISTCAALAQRELILTTPYFVPDEATLSAILTAARRGVAVTLVVPARNDSWLVSNASRSFYERLLGAGVRIREFHGGLLHAKTVTVDDRLALMTSANLDRRSFDINFEVSLLLYDAKAAMAMRALQSRYMERTTPVDRDVWSSRPWWTRLVQNAVGMASPIL